jgi:hypothetical protein
MLEIYLYNIEQLGFHPMEWQQFHQTEIVRILDTFTELTAELSARKKQYHYYRDQLLSFEEGEVDHLPMEMLY